MEIHRTKISRFTLLLAGLAFCATGLWLLLSPAQYRATARIKMLSDANNIIGLSGQARDPSVYDPYFIQTEIEIIQSEAVLRKVVEFLRLNTEWGEKYAGGNPLKTVESIRLLKHRVTAYVVPNTLYLIEIRATSKDPDEAAKIANAVAEAYREFRMEQRRQLVIQGIRVLTEQYQKEEKQIQVVQTNVEWLREECKVTNDVPPTELQQEWLREQTHKIERHEALPGEPYWEAKHKLDRMNEFHKLEKAKIEEEQMALNRLYNPEFSSGVKIVDLAIPPQTPEGPNRLLGVILFAIGLAMLAGEFFLARFSRRQSA